MFLIMALITVGVISGFGCLILSVNELLKAKENTKHERHTS